MRRACCASTRSLSMARGCLSAFSTSFFVISCSSMRKRIRQLEQLGEMPSDRLALAIGVGREIDVRGLFDRRAQLFDDVPLPLIVTYDGAKSLSTSTPSRLFGKIAHVADRREHLVARAQELLERSRLCGRFDDDERLGQ